MFLTETKQSLHFSESSLIGVSGCFAGASYMLDDDLRKKTDLESGFSDAQTEFGFLTIEKKRGVKALQFCKE